MSRGKVPFILKIIEINLIKTELKPKSPPRETFCQVVFKTQGASLSMFMSLLQFIVI